VVYYYNLVLQLDKSTTFSPLIVLLKNGLAFAGLTTKSVRRRRQ
jgi:hypothetical protein